jgi:hypothetical protein
VKFGCRYEKALIGASYSATDDARCQASYPEHGTHSTTLAFTIMIITIITFQCRKAVLWGRKFREHTIPEQTFLCHMAGLSLH